MTRSERRRFYRTDKKEKTRTFNFTESQLKAYVEAEVERIMEDQNRKNIDEAINTAMLLLLTLPMEVLMDHYWTRSYAKRIPEFTQHVLKYYKKWQNGELDMDAMQNDLWVYGGVRFVQLEEDQNERSDV